MCNNIWKNEQIYSPPLTNHIEWLTKLNLTNEFKPPSLVELPSICILSLGNKTIYVFKREKFRQISFQQSKCFAWWQNVNKNKILNSISEMGEQPSIKYVDTYFYCFDSSPYPKTSLQSLTGKLQGRITSQGDPCSHCREWVYRVQLSSVLVTFFSLF